MKKWYDNINYIATEVGKRNISSFSSSAAFFLFLSLIPALMLICAIIPFVPLTEADFMRVAVELAPANLEPMLVSMIHDVFNKSVGVVSITLLGTLWSAGKGMMAVMTGLNAVNEIEEKRNYFIKRAIACVFTVLILVTIILTLLIMVFGDVLIGLIEQKIPGTAKLFALLIYGRPVLFFLIITFVLTVIYAFLPGKRTRIRDQIFGAVLASLGWSVFTYGFSIYVGYYNGFSMYGNLTMIIVLLLWLYICIQLVMFGALINKFRIDKREKID